MEQYSNKDGRYQRGSFPFLTSIVWLSLPTLCFKVINGCELKSREYSFNQIAFKFRKRKSNYPFGNGRSLKLYVFCQFKFCGKFALFS